MEYINTVRITTKTEGFRLRLGLLNWSFGFQPKISLAFPKNLC